jgi:hypothetical protein
MRAGRCVVGDVPSLWHCWLLSLHWLSYPGSPSAGVSTVTELLCLQRLIPGLPPLCWMTSHVGTCPYSHCTGLSSCFSKLLLVSARCGSAMCGRWYFLPATLLNPFTMVTELLWITHCGWTYDLRPAACLRAESDAGCLGVCHYGQWATPPLMVEPQPSVLLTLPVLKGLTHGSMSMHPQHQTLLLFQWASCGVLYLSLRYAL